MEYLTIVIVAISVLFFSTRSERKSKENQNEIIEILKEIRSEIKKCAAKFNGHS